MLTATTSWWPNGSPPLSPATSLTLHTTTLVSWYIIMILTQLQHYKDLVGDTVALSWNLAQQKGARYIVAVLILIALSIKIKPLTTRVATIRWKQRLESCYKKNFEGQEQAIHIFTRSKFSPEDYGALSYPPLVVPPCMSAFRTVHTGVAGFVVNAEGQVLLVQEKWLKRLSLRHWKLPGGHTEKGWANISLVIEISLGFSPCCRVPSQKDPTVCLGQNNLVNSVLNQRYVIVLYCRGVRIDVSLCIDLLNIRGKTFLWVEDHNIIFEIWCSTAEVAKFIMIQDVFRYVDIILCCIYTP